MQQVIFQDLGMMHYQAAWDYQEKLLQENLTVKAMLRNRQDQHTQKMMGTASVTNPRPDSSQRNSYQSDLLNLQETVPLTTNHLLLVEHPPVFTLGKSGHEENILISSEEREQKAIQFYKTNRGGDITFHGPEQLVGYPILDLENFYTDIGKYLRNLEEVIILTMSAYGLKGERSAGETGVWLDTGIKGKERKICAMGVRCSRWITMHGFAFNINTDLRYFDYIIPCGIRGKAVTSMQQELGKKIPVEEVKAILKNNFEKVFEVTLR